MDDKLSSVSIIIPTLNEEDFLGYLLFSLSRQTFRDFEVIISDANSEDETIKVAESFRQSLPVLKITVSKERSPAKQRNEGAKLASFERLLFLDADVILPVDFLEKNLKELGQRKLDLAHIVSFPITNNLFDYYFLIVSCWIHEFLHRVIPLVFGFAIFSTKFWHEKLGGFNEKMRKIGEDSDYTFRASKLGATFGILKGREIYVSMRRMDVEGRFGLLKNLIWLPFLLAVFGRYKTQDLFVRPYGVYGKINHSQKK